jgi:hypothetical protein
MERVVIEVEDDDVAAIAAKIPRAESLAPGTRVVVRARRARARWLRGVFGKGGPDVAAMATALLARGFTSLGGGEDEGAVAAWGDA